MPGRFPFLDDDDLAGRLRGLVDGGSAAATGAGRPTPRVRSGELVLDSAVDPLDPLRSAAVLDSRQLVVRTDEFTIVIDVARDGDEWLLTGELLGAAGDDDLGPIVVQIVDTVGEELGLVVVGVDGEFECTTSDRPAQLIVACESGDVVVDLPATGP